MKILLISDLPPCTNHTSGLLIDRLCDYLLKNGHTVYAYIVKSDAVQVEIPQEKINKITFQITRKPRENWGAWKLKAFGSWIGDLYTTTFSVPRIIRSITSFSNELQPDLIWGIVQGQTMTRLIRPVSEKTQVPYIVQIFDPISWWLQANQVDRRTQKKVMKEYGRMIRSSRCLIGASEKMAVEFKNLYGCRDAVPIMMPFVPPHSKKRAGKRGEGEEKSVFCIALAGQLYAYDAILSLITSLQSMNWQYKGKRIIFRIYGANMHFDISSPCFLEYRGWVPQEQLLEELKEADLLYCPYRFEPDWAETARLSFPGKLSTYMWTGTPLLVHSPSYAGINTFVKSRRCGYVLESVEREDIVSMLKRIMDDEDRFKMAETAKRVLAEELSVRVMYRNFARALGLGTEA